MADFLFEIGLEEIPARMIAGAQAELEKRVMAMLGRERLLLEGASAESFSTPRRLAVRVRGVRERQEDVTEEMVGPSVKVGYKDGVPTAAAEAFARKTGVKVGELRTVSTAKGEYLGATAMRAGRLAKPVIETELPKELAAIYWAKTMYWRDGKPERFVRPVRWMLGLLGEEPVLVSFGGFTGGDVTYGHRVLRGAEPIVLGKPAEYEAVLAEARVLVDVERRRWVIRKGLDRVCRTVDGMRWREDHPLVDKMTHLTEWPTAVMGSFDAEFLRLPEEVLVTVMRDHQNYFAVEDGAGKLAPYFLAVLNTEVDAAGAAVIRHGNERVLRARFTDARFFWEFDQRVPLAERQVLLEKVTFQKDLGSYSGKTERVRALCAQLAGLARERGFTVSERALDEAAQLAKTDLTTELVKEFTELQGEVGGLYARAQGFSAAVADAVYDHYRPMSMDARIARTPEGQLLAIADKVDTILGMFGLGLEPTGSKDPFALRRAGNGIVKTLAESQVPLRLSDVGRGRVLTFLRERLEFYLRDRRGQAYDVVAAVLAAGADDVRDAVQRAEAVTAAQSAEGFLVVCAAFKRMKNILAQATENGFAVAATPGDLVEPAEIELARELRGRSGGIEALRASGDYGGALREIGGFGPLLNGFFDAVMVMAEDAGLRGKRLALLRDVLSEFSSIADFSEIVIAA